MMLGVGAISARRATMFLISLGVAVFAIGWLASNNFSNYYTRAARVKGLRPRLQIVSSDGTRLNSVFDGVAPDPRNLRNWDRLKTRLRLPHCGDPAPMTFVSRMLAVIGVGSTVHAQANCTWFCTAAGCGGFPDDTQCQGTAPCSGMATNGYSEGNEYISDEDPNNASHCVGSNCAGCWATSCLCPSGPGLPGS